MKKLAWNKVQVLVQEFALDDARICSQKGAR
jgi:hypothetical protein